MQFIEPHARFERDTCLAAEVEAVVAKEDLRIGIVEDAGVRPAGGDERPRRWGAAEPPQQEAALEPHGFAGPRVVEPQQGGAFLLLGRLILRVLGILVLGVLAALRLTLLSRIGGGLLLLRFFALVGPVRVLGGQHGPRLGA